MGFAPLRVAMPPASLGGWVSDYSYCSFRVLVYEDGIDGYERGGDEPGYDVAAGVGEDTVRWATEMGSHA